MQDQESGKKTSYTLRQVFNEYLYQRICTTLYWQLMPSLRNYVLIDDLSIDEILFKNVEYGRWFDIRFLI